MFFVPTSQSRAYIPKKHVVGGAKVDLNEEVLKEIESALQINEMVMADCHVVRQNQAALPLSFSIGRSRRDKSEIMISGGLGGIPANEAIRMIAQAIDEKIITICDNPYTKMEYQPILCGGLEFKVIDVSWLLDKKTERHWKNLVPDILFDFVKTNKKKTKPKLAYVVFKDAQGRYPWQGGDNSGVLEIPLFNVLH